MINTVNAAVEFLRNTTEGGLISAAVIIIFSVWLAGKLGLLSDSWDF